MKTINEQIQLELDDFTKTITEMVSDRFTEDHELEPVVFMLSIKEGKPAIGIVHGLGQLFGSDEGKDVAAEALKEINESAKPIATAFASEGWYLSTTKDKSSDLIDKEGRMKVRPSDHPDRLEMLFINFETHDRICMVTWSILREEGQPPMIVELNPPEWVSKKVMVVQGRFGNLLETNYNEFVQQLKLSMKENKN